jgi:hypothetical protein
VLSLLSRVHQRKFVSHKKCKHRYIVKYRITSYNFGKHRITSANIGKHWKKNLNTHYSLLITKIKKIKFPMQFDATQCNNIWEPLLILYFHFPLIYKYSYTNCSRYAKIAKTFTNNAIILGLFVQIGSKIRQWDFKESDSECQSELYKKFVITK